LAKVNAKWAFGLIATTTHGIDPYVTARACFVADGKIS
jgi:hypothetical protein